MTRVHVLTFEGTDIYVDEEGYFYATPPGCRKERNSASMYNIKNEIRKVVERARQKKRKDVNYPVAIFDEDKGHVDVNAKYVGVRGKDTDYLSAGHIIELNGRKKSLDNYRRVRVVPKGTSQDDILELEAAHELMRAAQADYKEKLAKATVSVKPSHISTYEPTAAYLIQAQEKGVKEFQKAYDPATEDSTA